MARYFQSLLESLGCNRRRTSRLVSLIDVACRCLDHIAVRVVAQMWSGARFASHARNEADLLDFGETGLWHLKDRALSWRDAAFPEATLSKAAFCS
jgi:hypothetical protein